MFHKISGSFRKLSLTQQVLVLILLMLAFLTVFFTFFLSDSINQSVSRQIYDMMAARQAPIVRALDMGKSASYDVELFNYLASDSSLNTGVVSENRTVMLSQADPEAAQGFIPVMEEQARSMLRAPANSFEEGSTKIEGKTFYYRLEKADYKGISSVIFSYMNDSYAKEVKTMLTDSTVYITVLAFCLILMVFVFWVFSIIHPLNQIKTYISQIKQGKEVDLYINRDDEIGEVAKELRTLTEELAKQEKSKEEMIHNISHDLKTPIATIKSYSESIKDGIFPYGDLESSVDVILDNAERLEHKVHSLLYMNRVEYLVSSDATGVVTNMKEVVEQVVLNAAMIRPEIEIITEVEEVFFDGLIEAWRVCVENIMENAFRYAKSYIKIQVRDNELRISNDGPKMPEDRIDSLFKPYIKGEGGRFGLGLSIVYKVVQANKYKVKGMNTEDGVCFMIYRDVPKTNQRQYSFKAPNMQNIHLNTHRKTARPAAKSEDTGSSSAQKNGKGQKKEDHSGSQNSKQKETSRQKKRSSRKPGSSRNRTRTDARQKTSAAHTDASADLKKTKTDSAKTEQKKDADPVKRQIPKGKTENVSDKKKAEETAAASEQKGKQQS